MVNQFKCLAVLCSISTHGSWFGWGLCTVVKSFLCLFVYVIKLHEGASK